MKNQILILICIICVVSGSVLGIYQWLGEGKFSLISLFIILSGLISGLIPFFISSDYIKNYNRSDWQMSSEGYSIVITKTKHGIRHPSTTVYKSENGKYLKVVVQIDLQPNGDVIVSVNFPFDCKIVIN
ncbi:hypothetical protein AB4Y90_09665 [Chryseobacterium sp. 2TAF14]|uniref:hypothetical protein n=1 Tax=Chryseobacterium sp. 2TAF14 TaxID=3233007 RepID=UPI003F935945